MAIVVALAVRTLTSAHVLKVMHPSSSSQPEHVVEILHSDVGDKRIVDMIFLPTPHEEVVLLVVNGSGGVYKCSIKSEIKSM